MRITRASTRQATAASKSTVSTVKKEDGPPASRRKRAATNPQPPVKRIKTEDDDDDDASLSTTPSSSIKPEPLDSSSKATTTPSPPSLQAKKLKAYTQHSSRLGPFPSFAHPTPSEARLAHNILTTLHGARIRPSSSPSSSSPSALKAPTSRAGCGDSPSVLDALVRTILSQNTSDANSTRAKLSMDAVYGASDAWAAIADGGVDKLQDAIKCGGLSTVKSRVIMDILTQARARYGAYSLDHLFGASDEDAMKELVGLKGVGPKTASCVLLFCLGRASFAVDTHVWRITGLLGWRPQRATRDETHAHLDARVPDEDKYGLHVLLVKHGRVCAGCRAGGQKSLGKCELRRAFEDRGKAEISGLSDPAPEIPEDKSAWPSGALLK